MSEPNESITPPDSEDRLIATAMAELESVSRGGAAVDTAAFCEQFPIRIRDKLRRLVSLHLALGRLESSESGSRIEVPAVPVQLGRYRVIDTLGRGGMGIVYRAHDEELARDVALKVLAPNLVQDELARQRFVREARALAQIRHPHVIPIHDVGQDGSFLYFTMDLMSRSLATAGVLPDTDRVATVLRWTADAALGLGHAHARNILHRDVKPGNLLLDHDGRVRVADFGLARIDVDGASTVTMQPVGTLRYTAPEVLAGTTYSARSDIYGLAATAYQLLAGRAPPIGTPPPRIATVRRRVADVVARGLAADPADRYPDMDAFERDLRALADDRRPSRFLPRRPIVAIVGLGIAAVATAVIVGLALHDDRRSPAPVLHGGQTMWSGELARWDPAFRVRAESLDLTATSESSLEADGRRFRARLVTTGGETRLVLEAAGGRRVAMMLLDAGLFPEPSRCQLVMSSPDVNADGLPESLLRFGDRLLLVQWDTAAWGSRPDWRIVVANSFSYGSPAVFDWDGDGRLEVVVGDTGTDTTGLNERDATVYAIDYATGEIRRRWQVAGIVRSTPQPLVNAAGRVTAVYLDVEVDRTHRRPGGLFRIDWDVNTPERLTPPEYRDALTWPVFADIDGDRQTEVLIGGYTGVFALDAVPPTRVRWSFPTKSLVSYLALSQQDGDPEAEVCFTAQDRFYCLNVEPAAEPRIAWSVPMTSDCVAKPMELGDLDGDGLAELACGAARTGHAVAVMSARSTAKPLVELEPSPEAIAEAEPMSAVPFFAARVAVVPGSPTQPARVIAANHVGWVLAWSVTAGGSSLAWSYATRATIIASPQLLAIGDRHAVVIADNAGWIRVLGPIEAPTPDVLWSFKAHTAIGGTPVIVDDGKAGRSLVFTDSSGAVYRMMLRGV